MLDRGGGIRLTNPSTDSPFSLRRREKAHGILALELRGEGVFSFNGPRRTPGFNRSLTKDPMLLLLVHVGKAEPSRLGGNFGSLVFRVGHSDIPISVLLKLL